MKTGNVLSIALLAAILVCSPLSQAEAIPVEDAGTHLALESGNTVRVFMKMDLGRIKHYTKNIEEHTDIIKQITEFNDAINPELWANKEFTDMRTIKEDVDSVFSQFADIANKLQMFFAIFHKPEWFKEAAGTPIDQVNKINKEISKLYDDAHSTFYEEINKGIGLVDNSRALMQDNIDWADNVNAMLAQDEISEKDIKLATLTGIMRLANISGSLESIVAQNSNITLQKALKDAEQSEYARKRAEVLFDSEGITSNSKNKLELKAGYQR